MTTNEEITTLRRKLSETRADLQLWKNSHADWMRYAKSLEVQLQQVNAQRAAEQPVFDWEPAPFEVGWKPDGNHDAASRARSHRPPA